MTQEELFKNLTAHAKEYGFIFPSSEIYDGLGAVYDYGQMGVELKNNIKKYWWDSDGPPQRKYCRNRLGNLHAPYYLEGFGACGCFQ